MLGDELITEVDRIVRLRGYQNLFEAFRDLACGGLRETAHPTDCHSHSLAAFIYVYSYGAQEVSKDIAKAFHEHHDLTLAMVHVHLDHESRLAVALLKGKTAAVESHSNHIIAERGVRHGRIFQILAEMKEEAHAHEARTSRRYAPCPWTLVISTAAQH